MGRGELDNATLASIWKQLPPLEDLEKTVLSLSPDLISAKFKSDRSVPRASVCLQDAVNALAEARYALHEAVAHMIWYRKKTNHRW